MKPLVVSRGTLQWLRIIGAAQAGPAVYLLIAALSSESFTRPLYVSLLLYGYLGASIYFGLSLFGSRRLGAIGSLVIQVVQVFQAENDFFTWRIQLAGFLGPHLSGPVLGPRIHLGPLLLARGPSDPEQIYIGVNLLAIGALTLLAHALGSAAAPSTETRSSA